jgi:hypothetical protein
MTIANPFNDDFSGASVGPAWIQPGGAGLVGTLTQAAGVLTLDVPAAATVAGTLFQSSWRRIGLPVGDKNFVFQVSITALTVDQTPAPASIAAAGIGLGFVASSVALEPLFEIGGLATASPKFYGSLPMENEIGRAWERALPTTVPFHVRVVRADDVVYAEYRPNASTTWRPLVENGSVQSHLLMHRRYHDTSGTALEGDVIWLYIRVAHQHDAAGVNVSFDNASLSTWDRYSTAPLLANLQAKTNYDGSRVDLSWENPPAGEHEVRWMRIERSVLAHPEMASADSLRTRDPDPLLRLNMSEAAVQYLPASASTWADRYPLVVTPTHGWLFDSDSPSGAIGAASFTAGGSASNRGVGDAVGLEGGGGSCDSCLEIFDTTSGGGAYAELSDASVCEPSARHNFAGWGVHRFVRPAAAARDIINKDEAGGASYFRVWLDASGFVNAEVLNAGVSATCQLAVSHANRAWVAIAWAVDWNANRLLLWSSLAGLVTSVGTLPVNTVFATSSSSLRLGTSRSAGRTPANVQTRALYVWDGDTSLAVRETQWLLMFTHGALPFLPDLPEGTVAAYTRASVAAGGFGYATERSGALERVAAWAGSSAYADAQFWHGASKLYSHPSGIDGRFDVAAVNLATNSERTTGLTLTSASSDSERDLSPMGTYTAMRFTQTALDGRLFASFSGLAVGTDYTFSIWLADPSDTGGHAVTVWFRDGADTTVDVNQEHLVYVPPYFRRYSWTVNTGAGTSIGVRLYGGRRGVDTNKPLRHWGRQIEARGYASDYVPTDSVVVTRAAPTLSVTGPGLGSVLSRLSGELRLDGLRLSNDAALSYAVQAVRSTGGSTDRRDLYVFDSLPETSVYNDAGAIVFTIMGASAISGVPVDLRAYWSFDGSDLGGVFGKLFYNGAQTDGGGAAAWTSGDGVDRLWLGTTSAGAFPWMGGIAAVGLWPNVPSHSVADCQIPYGAGRDPLSTVIYTGAPVAAFSDANLPAHQLYYYAVFTSRVPHHTADGTANPPFLQPQLSWPSLLRQPGVTDAGAPAENRVAGLAMRDLVGTEGNRFYNDLPAIYRERDEQERRITNRVSGLLADWTSVVSRGLAFLRELTHAAHTTRDAEIGPLGLIGKAHSQHSIVDVVLADRGINARAIGASGHAKRRLWVGAVDAIKRKGAIGMVGYFVEVITGWRDVVVAEPGNGVELRFLRTWDGFTTRTSVAAASSALTFGAGFFNNPFLSMAVDQYAGGLYLDWFGNVKRIASNTATRINFVDTTFVPERERVYTGVPVTGGNTATLPVTVNDDQYNDGQIHQTPLAAAVDISDTSYATRTITAAGLTNSASDTVAIAFGFSGTFAARDPIFQCWLISGETSWLYDPAGDLALVGGPDDPFFRLWSGLSPNGSGFSYPVTPDDVVVWAPDDAARYANREVVNIGIESVTLRGWMPDVRPGDYVNPNRNQPRWFRVTGVWPTGGGHTRISIDQADDLPVTPADVAEVNDLGTVVPEITWAHDRALRALLPLLLPLNSRVFVYYR